MPEIQFAGQGYQTLEQEQDRHTSRQTNVTERITSLICGWQLRI